jgi:hypothetical protein
LYISIMLASREELRPVHPQRSPPLTADRRRPVLETEQPAASLRPGVETAGTNPRDQTHEPRQFEPTKLRPPPCWSYTDPAGQPPASRAPHPAPRQFDPLAIRTHQAPASAMLVLHRSCRSASRAPGPAPRAPTIRTPAAAARRPRMPAGNSNPPSSRLRHPGPTPILLVSLPRPRPPRPDNPSAGSTGKRLLEML